jgi:E3 SUMO-protein ligase RanBP2
MTGTANAPATDTSSLFKSAAILNTNSPAGFTGGIKPSQQPPKPMFGAPSTSNKEAAGDEGDENENHENPEEYEPQVDFKPLVKLQEVEVKTGEENEDALFKQRCKLYRFETQTKEWKEKGTGEIKLLKHKQNANMFRILMRRDQVLKLCANHRITSDLKFEIFNEKQVRWHAQDYSEGEGKHETLAARFRSEEDAKKFKQECENAQVVLASSEGTTPTKPVQKEPVVVDPSKPSLSQMFKNDDSVWTCTGCYVKNKKEIVKCVACGTLAPGATAPPTSTNTTINKR